MSSNQVFNHLKAFSYDIQSDISKMKRFLSAKHTNVSEFDENFLQNLHGNVHTMNQSLNALESKLYGTISSRLAFVTMDEFYEKAESLYLSNEKLIQAMKAKLSKTSQQSVPPKSLPNENTVIEDECDQENVPPQNYRPQTNTLETSANRGILADIPTEANSDECFEVEYDLCIEDRPSTLLPGSTSPLCRSPTKQDQTSRLSLGDVKTPTLDWKLSDATKALVRPKPSDDMNYSKKLDFMMDDGDYSDCKSIGQRTPASPSDLNLSMNTQLLTTLRLDDESPINTERANSLLLSPSTPGALTPFNTCTLRDAPSFDSNHEIYNHSPESAIPSFDVVYDDSVSRMDEEVVYSMEDEVPVRNEVNTSYLSDEKSIDISPLKIAKLLQPRTGVNARRDGWILSVRDDEWTLAPGFLQKQVTLDMLNNSIDKLNAYIDEKSEPVESISQNDLVELLTSLYSHLVVKTVIMAIVCVKRLDISNEGGVKHYRIKKV